MSGEISFSGFGPITQSKPTFSGGFGRAESFVPLNKKPINFSEAGKQKPNAGFAFLGYNPPTIQDGNQVYDVYLGQSDQGPQWIREISSLNIQNEIIINDGTQTTKAEFSADLTGTNADGIVSLYTKQDSGNQEIYLEVNEGNGTSLINSKAGGANGQTISIKNDDGNGYTEIKGISTATSSFSLKVNTNNNPALTLDDGDGHNVIIDIPTGGSGTNVSASWKEFDMCHNGVPGKIKVLATDPY